MMHRCFSIALAVLFVLTPFTRAQPADDKARLLDFFEKKIRPVLADNCYTCHGPKKQSVDIRLDRRDTAMAGNDDGPIIVPGHPEKSRLGKAIQHDSKIKMPPKEKLPDAVIADFTAWIKSGAAWPEDKNVAGTPQTDAKTHWAFQPVKKPPLPAVKQADWPANPVDFFILAKLEAKGIKPNAPADRRTLLRRLKIDLLGLPPTFEEVAAFEADTSPDAYAKVVDRYLASP